MIPSRGTQFDLGKSGSDVNGVLGAAGEVFMQQQMIQMMEGLQQKIEKMQQTQEKIAEENKRMRQEVGGVGGAYRGKGQHQMEEEEDDDDKVVLRNYKVSDAAVMDALNAGGTPSAENYAERDLHLFRLSDTDLRAEYERYTQMYLDERTNVQTRGMAEMTLIKLGEIVDKPQQKRIKMLERAAEEQRAAVEARKRKVR